MHIKFVEVFNFRKLKATHIDFDVKTTIFVGANNSGKTSAMTALRYFLVTPKNLAVKDITIANWPKINSVGDKWEQGEAPLIDLNELLPCLDVWLSVSLAEIRHVVHILPTLEWNGGDIGVRLQYQVEDLERLRADYLHHRSIAKQASTQKLSNDGPSLELWPSTLNDYLSRELHRYVTLEAYTLDPNTKKKSTVNGIAVRQTLPTDAFVLGKNPLDGLIQIDEIAAQRDFADAGTKAGNEDSVDGSARRYKRKLSEQLRRYYDKHLDPSKTPSESDYDALCAMQSAERSFDNRLEAGFAPALAELQAIGYPGIANPKLKITTHLKAIDGLKHASALQYVVSESGQNGEAPFKLPEDYSGLGYQNLIAMVFMLMAFRDDWMCVGKAQAESLIDEMKIPPIHLVLVEEPEAHLHAQVQQVFINNAYELLRNHSNLGDETNFQTQLVVSTHSSHVAHEVDFSNLRYFRRRPASSPQETATTTVANLSTVFGDEDVTKRFVKRYLKATHCDLFFADGVIFVEGQAERILIPNFIRNHFKSLSRRYVTLLEVGGSHAHKFTQLIDELGIATLVISDIDAVELVKSTGKTGKEKNSWNSVRPQVGQGQKTANSVLKNWHPKKTEIDDLIALNDDDHICKSDVGYALYVAYQKTIDFDGQSVIPRTFEDALIYENHALLKKLDDKKIATKVKKIVDSGSAGDELENQLFDLLKGMDKAEFAMDCLMMEEAPLLMPPAYIKAGLEWFDGALSEDLIATTPVEKV